MLQSLSVAATGMQAQETRTEVIANNLANASTPGFKVSRARFQDLLYINEREAGTQSSPVSYVPTGKSIGLGTRTAAVDQIFTEGELENTGNPLDLAVEGDGLFQISMPDGSIAYTRDGSFRLDQNGRLVTLDGYPLLPGINIPQGARNPTVGPDGTVSVQVNNQTVPTQIGQVQLVRFLNPAGLMPIGQNLYLESEGAGPPQVGIASENGFGVIMQGFLEMPNESVVQEMVGLIEAQRAYEASSKAVSIGDNMQSIANNLVK
ncbi:MAG: flagellar basal-body rod protein FlgG [Deltaproteobacteria bacterium]|jgi:flagellar basal-body rod protein FlgG|nr:flagellar basal-body rod protein FlgG [Deltaproteobacteria bacterium]